MLYKFVWNNKNIILKFERTLTINQYQIKLLNKIVEKYY